MRNKIFGGIGILWGGALILKLLFGEATQGSGAYGAGLIIGKLMGIVMFLSGLYYFFQSSDEEPVKKKKKKRIEA